MTTVRLMFDPDLPLFSVEVEGHSVEIYFYGSKPSGKKWRAYIGADQYDFADLQPCWDKVEEILEERTGMKIELSYPMERR